MKTKTFPLVLAFWLALAAGFLTACDKDGHDAVEADRDAQGDAHIHVDGKEVQDNLDKAGEQLEQAGDQIAQGAQEAGAALERGAEKVEKEVGPVLDDAAITASIKAKLIADPEVKAFQIDVDTVDGRVALNGKVASAEQRAEAEDLARGTQGVRQVVNLIQVAGQDVPLQAPPGR
jgi:hyperosmotically inducible protein